MNVEQLSEFVGKPEIHRKVLGNYSGGYALGVTETGDKKQAALSLSVEGRNGSSFPRKIKIDGQSVPIIVQTNWSVPRFR